jgi:hypothetical protein
MWNHLLLFHHNNWVISSFSQIKARIKIKFGLIVYFKHTALDDLYFVEKSQRYYFLYSNIFQKRIYRVTGEQKAMKIEQRQWTEQTGWLPSSSVNWRPEAQVVFIFGSKKTLNNQGLLETLRLDYTGAYMCGCSTAGEIRDVNVTDEALIATAVCFEHTRVEIARVNLNEVGRNSYKAGAKLARALLKDGLVHIFVLSDGLNINGSELAKGIQVNIPETVSVTGGLAGDGPNFQETQVISERGRAEKDIIVALGFYGDRLRMSYGSAGGWDPFGPERLITRSQGNVLFQLDGHSALELYKKYLGEQAQGLPATGLLFPLSVRSHSGDVELVRTILSINEAEQSMTFAGDLPQGAYGRLMKANFDRLIDGAVSAAKMSHKSCGEASPDLAILISCVGRKLVLKQRIEEEVEGVREVLGAKTAITGFYSYGEICPPKNGQKCELHNQTMTITTFSES